VQESEFRDWARRAQGNFDERLRGLEAKVGEMAAAAAGPHVGGELAVAPKEMASELMEAVRVGGLRGLAIVYLGPNGPVDGWAYTGDEDVRLALYGAVCFLADKVLHPGKEGPALYEAAAGAASGRTDEESSEAREVAASAPAGG
jgi:hypothetical protein